MERPWIYVGAGRTGRRRSAALDLIEPGLLYTLGVDGEPLAILVWADTEERLAAFMPTADALLVSIRLEER